MYLIGIRHFVFMPVPSETGTGRGKESFLKLLRPGGVHVFVLSLFCIIFWVCSLSFTLINNERD